MERLEDLARRLARACTPERVRRYPPTVALVFLCVWVGTFVAWRRGPITDRWGKLLGNDFVAFYTGARLWLTGRGELLYDLSAQLELQRGLTAAQLDHFTPFINPPHAVLWYAPFALGGYLPGLLAWWAVGLGCLAAAAAMARRAQAALGDRPAWHLGAVALCFPPTLSWLGFGQASMLVWMILTATWLLLARRRDFAAGLTLSMLAFKPQLALGWAIPLIAARRWRAIAGGALGLSAWGAISALWFRPSWCSGGRCAGSGPSCCAMRPTRAGASTRSMGSSTCWWARCLGPWPTGSRCWARPCSWARSFGCGGASSGTPTPRLATARHRHAGAGAAAGRPALRL